MAPDEAMVFAVMMSMIGIVGWILNSWMRNRHALRLAQVNSERGNPDGDRKVELLTSENERLHGQIGRLEGRIAVLERIATDPAERTARDIDALRGR
jgi:hypothetical protein